MAARKKTETDTVTVSRQQWHAERQHWRDIGREEGKAETMAQLLDLLWPVLEERIKGTIHDVVDSRES